MEARVSKIRVTGGMSVKSMTKLANFMTDESGAAAAEYALILALIAVVIIASLTTLGSNISAVFANVTIATALGS